jgi:UDPglucose 6-dehydrogenase
LGFAGGTLARDLRVLQEIGNRQGYDAVLINAVLDVNRRQNYSVVKRLTRIVGDLSGKTVGVLGLTYKAGTSTLRRSAALEIVKYLQNEGAKVQAFDPRVSKADTYDLLQLCEGPYETARGADALVIMTDWPEFQRLDFKRIHGAMRSPVVLDTQNMMDRQEMSKDGINYFGIGRGRRQE